jgi:hypothetical protein
MSRLHNVTEMMLGYRMQALQAQIPEIFFPPEPLAMLLSTMAGKSLQLLAIAIQLGRPTNTVASGTMPPILGNYAKWGQIDKILDDSEGYPVLRKVYLVFDFGWSENTIFRSHSLSNINDHIKSCFPKLIASRRLHLRR